ncbi:ERCC4 domain-containing protein [Fuchsiella alkaliacetigena]|uniref:ERCC4 domain-containing protein n=1 Tax=Fuchsiella alkaliacetigena TaxID=957042 RepID=UPI00200A3DA3|nr:ERCC4 domain-containing protein [Fuchsiella alkaliacetigena]MCK8823995.1 ERCC4 domain-containing protein [Fuchsiella alkaliacetigena]
MLAVQNKLPYRYMKTELRQLLKSMTILVDTQEQKNKHITLYLSKHNTPFKSKKLEFGDYSMMLPANEELGIIRDIYFDNQIAIERKSNLEELSNNLTQGRTQFENELIRASNSKLILLIEDARAYEKILNHNYNTKYKPKSFLGSLMAFQARYDIDIQFLNSSYSGNFIRWTFYYWLREFLK